MTIGLLPNPNDELNFHKYIEALAHPEENNPFKPPYYDLKSELSHYTLQKVQQLYLNLRHVFNLLCCNEERSNIIKSFSKVDPSEWPVLTERINFIMPENARGHDLMWTTRILVSAENPDKLIEIANRFFKRGMRSIEKAYILDNLSKKTIEELEAADTWSAEIKAEFIRNAIPSIVIEGLKPVAIFDPIANNIYKA